MENKIPKKSKILILARVISFVFHPLFMPLFGLILMSVINTHVKMEMPYELRKLLIFWLFIITVFFPIISTFVLVRSRIISSFQMVEKKERTTPYLLILFYYLLGYYMFSRGDLPIEIYCFLSGIIITIILLIIITPFWKISAHMVGIGGLVGGIIAFAEINSINLGTVAAVAIFIAGAVGTARLVLQSHKPAEVYAGAILGFTTLYIVLKLKFYV